jgi:ribosomal protein S18 acetylase RimI-like enzyme
MPERLPFSSAQYSLHHRSADGAVIVLRLMTRADAESLGRQFADIDPWARLGSRREDMIGFLALTNDAKRCFTILSDGDRAGAVVVRHPWLVGPYLNMLAILPEHQREGIGRAVMLWLEQEALATGSRNCFLSVSAFNVAAIAFYRKCGYSPVAFLDDLITDGEDEILMRKRLPKPQPAVVAAQLPL